MSRRRTVSRLNYRALSALGEKSSQLLLDRRQFLFGAAAVVAATSPLAKASASVGGYRLRTKKGRGGNVSKVTVSLGRGTEWTLDTALFVGTPVLEVVRRDATAIITLTGARYPGTPFNLNLEATIEPSLIGHNLTIRFTDTGVKGADFTVHAPLNDWIQGKAEAKTNISASQADHFLSSDSLMPHVGMEAVAAGTVRYLSDGSLTFSSETLAKADGHVYGLGALAIQVLPRSSESFLSGETRSLTRLKGVRSGNWDHGIRLTTDEGWSVTGDATGFRTLTCDALETGVSALVLQGTGGLTAELPRQLEFELHNTILAKQLGVEGDLLLQADASDQGTWIHDNGFSVEIAHQADVPFVVRSNREGSLTCQPLLQAKQVNFGMDDAIVTARGFEPQPIDLVLPQIQKKVIRPKAVVPAQVFKPVDQKISEDAGVKFLLRPQFRLEIVRYADLLNLSFEFVNLRIASGDPPHLEREDATKPAYVIVQFPPQSVSEETFFDTATSPEQILPNGFAPPIQSRVARPTRLCFFIPTTISTISLSITDAGGLLDWEKWNQSVAATAISSYGPKITVDVKAKSPVFSKPPLISRPMTKVPIKKGGTLMLARPMLYEEMQQPIRQIAVSPIAKNTNPTKIFNLIPTGRIPLRPTDTRIEIPTWLTISPTEEARWFHRRPGDIQTDSSGTTAALWHTTLGGQNDAAQAVEASDDGKWYYLESPEGRQGPFRSDSPVHPTVRAIDAYDYDKPQESVPNPAMQARDRKDLVDNMTFRTNNRRTDSQPFIVQRLQLTSLGGTLKGSWTYLAGTEPLQSGGGPSLVGWSHNATLGRDHKVTLVRRGFLYPTMHQALKVEVSERKFQHDAKGNTYAVLRKRVFVMVTQPTVRYSELEARGLGFQSISCLTRETPKLDTDADLMWIASAGKPFLMAMKGLDIDGNPISWNQSCGFVEWNAGLAVAHVVPFGGAVPPGGPSVIGGVKVSMAPSPTFDPSTTKQKPSGTIFPMETLSIGALSGTPDPKTGVPNFRPKLDRASVRIPAIEQFQGASGGTPQMLSLEALNYGNDEEWALAAADAAAGDEDRMGPVDVTYSSIYLQNGFDPTGNPSEVFLKLLTKVDAKFTDTGKSGGVVNPNTSVGAISRKLGPLGEEPVGGSISNANTRPAGPATAKILGAVNIWDLLPASMPTSDNDLIPKFTLGRVYEEPDEDDGHGTTTPAHPATPAPAGGTGGSEHEQKATGIKVGIEWAPKLGNWPTDKPIFVGHAGKTIFSDNKDLAYFGVDPEDQATLKLTAELIYYFRRSTSDSSHSTTPPAPADHGSSSSSSPPSNFSFKLEAELSWFRVDAIAPWTSVIYVDVQRIKFSKEIGKPLKFYVDIPKISFTGPLSFIQDFENLIGGGGASVHFPSADRTPGKFGPPGGELLASTSEMAYYDGFEFKPFMEVSGEGLCLGFTLGFPDLTVGAFALTGVSLTAKVTLPFVGDSFTIEFDFCTRDDPFALSVYGITGGGFFGVQVTGEGLKSMEGALEFGASYSASIGIASGKVSLMAGIYFKMERVAGTDHFDTTLTGYVRLSGKLTLFSFISVSIEFYLSLTYESNGNKLTGEATVTIEVSISFFSISVSLTARKEFAGSGGSSSMLFASTDAASALPPPIPVPLFTQSVSTDDWIAYCDAYGDN